MINTISICITIINIYVMAGMLTKKNSSPIASLIACAIVVAGVFLFFTGLIFAITLLASIEMKMGPVYLMTAGMTTVLAVYAIKGGFEDNE